MTYVGPPGLLAAAAACSAGWTTTLCVRRVLSGAFTQIDLSVWSHLVGANRRRWWRGRGRTVPLCRPAGRKKKWSGSPGWALERATSTTIGTVPHSSICALPVCSYAMPVIDQSAGGHWPSPDRPPSDLKTRLLIKVRSVSVSVGRSYSSRGAAFHLYFSAELQSFPAWQSRTELRFVVTRNSLGVDSLGFTHRLWLTTRSETSIYNIFF